MPNQMTLNPLVLVKFVLWIAVVIVATILLQRRKVTSKMRLAFLFVGMLLFGFLFGLLIPGDLNPNPVSSLRTLLTTTLVRHQLVLPVAAMLVIPLLPVAAMLVILLLTVWVSNKSICGWGCQLGLLQDLLHRVPLPKWKPPFWLSNSVRIVAFVALIVGLTAAGLDWIGLVDPFQLFSFDFTLGIGLFSAGVLIASLFIYRPWCRFLCPFGLLGWLVEQPVVRQSLSFAGDGRLLRWEENPRRLFRLRGLHRGLPTEGCAGLATERRINDASRERNRPEC